MYVKAYVFPTAKDVWRQVTSRRALTPRARREWRSLALQQDIGLPVVRRVAIGDIRRFGLVRAAVLVTEEMAGAQPLPAWLRERSWAVAPEILGAYVALLHERGFVHGDLNARNLLVRDLPDGGVDIRNLDAGCGRALRWRGEMTAAHARDVAPLVIAFEEILGRDAAAEYVRSYVTALGVERTAGMEQRLAAAVASVRPRESRRLR